MYLLKNVLFLNLVPIAIFFKIRNKGPNSGLLFGQGRYLNSTYTTVIPGPTTSDNYLDCNLKDSNIFIAIPYQIDFKGIRSNCPLELHHFRICGRFRFLVESYLSFHANLIFFFFENRRILLEKAGNLFRFSLYLF